MHLAYSLIIFFIQVDSMRGSLEVTQKGSSNPPKSFTFDNVFGPDSKQADVYNEVSVQGSNYVYCIIILVKSIVVLSALCNKYNV